MSISIIQPPKTVTPVHNDNYVIVDSNQVNNGFGFFYLFEFFVAKIGESKPSTPALSLKVLPNPLNQGDDYLAGRGELNVNKVLEDLTQFELIDFGNEAIINNTLNTNCLRYWIDVSEVYSTTASGAPIKQGTTQAVDAALYLIDGVLYNSQYWDFDEDLLALYIKGAYIAGENPQPIFLTNRPSISDTAEVDSLHIINSGANSATNNYSPDGITLSRQPDAQPITGINWLVEGEEINNLSVSLDAQGTGEDWTSKILAISGGYWAYDFDNNGNIGNPYFLQTDGNPSYNGSWRKWRNGVQLSDITIQFTLERLLPFPFSSHNGMIQILGRTPNTNTWTVLASANSTTQGETVFDYIIGFPSITLAANYDELGVRFINVPYDGVGIYAFTLGWFSLNYTSAQSSLLVKGYNDANQLRRVEEFLLDNTFKAQGVKWNKLWFEGYELKYMRAFVAVTAENILDESLLSILSETKRIEYKCKSVFGSKTKNIVWQNRLGGWDSYEFSLVQNVESSMRKETYITPTSKLSTRESLQRRSTGRVFNQTVTLITDNVSKETINWLKEMMDAEYIYELQVVDNQYRLVPIYVTTDSFSEKPFNNVFSQLRFSYNFSQIEPTR